VTPPARAGGRGRPWVACTAPPAFPDLHDDWPLQRAALATVGLDAVAQVWSDPAVDWSRFDLVVANGAWDNIHHQDAFLRWVAHVEGLGVPMVNRPATLRWNLDKRYLRELAAAGVRIVPTRWVEPGDDRDGEDDAGGGEPGAAEPFFDGEVVVKPAVSGGGFQTARYRPHEHDAARRHVASLVRGGTTAMIQPYQVSVDSDGETGLVFIGGEYSHAIHKEPMIRPGVPPGDSLIDNQVVTGASATLDQLRLARAAVGAAGALLGPATYARVDLVRDADGQPALLELELLDPVLFMTTAPSSAGRFARAVARELAGS
jgi:glutathione synthase/RimK-type ligase-like ATP-grasp enzyme